MTAIVDVDLSQQKPFNPSAIAEWASVCGGRHNVLLEGPDASTQGALALLTPHLSEPAVWKRIGAPLLLPAGECGTLVVQDVAALDIEAQARLLAWLNDPSHRGRVIATTAQPLFPLVASGQFDEVLYYRLNVMLLRTADPTGRSQRALSEAVSACQPIAVAHP